MSKQLQTCLLDEASCFGRNYMNEKERTKRKGNWAWFVAEMKLLTNGGVKQNNWHRSVSMKLQDGAAWPWLQNQCARAATTIAAFLICSHWVCLALLVQVSLYNVYSYVTSSLKLTSLWKRVRLCPFLTCCAIHPHHLTQGTPFEATTGRTH